jgi:hypothetical protein
MDALLLSLLLCLLLSLGNRLGAFLASGQRSVSFYGVLLAGLAIASTLWAVAGAALAPVMTPEARNLFMALALAVESAILFTGGVRGARVRRLSRGALLIDGFADIVSGGGAFLIVAIAAAFADPWMAGLGGWIGRAIALVIVPQLMVLGNWPSVLRALQLVGGLLGIISSFFMAMSALRLV